MQETVARNVSYKITIDSTNADDFVELYSPGTKNGVDLDGYLTDFRCDAQIRSTTELIPPEPTDPLASEQKIENEKYAYAADHSGKRLDIYISSGGDVATRKKGFSIILWNRNPQFSTSVLDYITENQAAIIQHGITFWGKIEAYNSPAGLAANDSIAFWIAGYEEAQIDITDVTQLQQSFYTVLMPLANTEYSFPIPEGAQGYAIKARGDTDAGDVLANIRYAWEADKVESANGYDVIGPAAEESEVYVAPMTGKTLYLASATPGVTVLVKIWQ